MNLINEVVKYWGEKKKKKERMQILKPESTPIFALPPCQAVSNLDWQINPVGSIARSGSRSVVDNCICWTVDSKEIQFKVHILKWKILKFSILLSPVGMR